jgi:hypothetical protein
MSFHVKDLVIHDMSIRNKALILAPIKLFDHAIICHVPSIILQYYLHDTTKWVSINPIIISFMNNHFYQCELVTYLMLDLLKDSPSTKN